MKLRKWWKLLVVKLQNEIEENKRKFDVEANKIQKEANEKVEQERLVTRQMAQKKVVVEKELEEEIKKS
jgi:hypothetical protein